MNTFLQIMIIASAAFLTLLILVQQRGASLGAGFGMSSELHTARRGTDKTIHELTIVVAIVFVCSLIVGLIRS